MFVNKFKIMKKLLLVALLFTLYSCDRVAQGDIVTKITTNGYSGTLYMVKDGGYFYAPTNLYEIGDTVKFTK